MDFAVSNRPLDKIKADALVIGLGKKSDLPEVLPDATRKQISAFIKAGDFNGSKGQHAWLHGPGIWLPLILLVGTGDNTLRLTMADATTQHRESAAKRPDQACRLPARQYPCADTGVAGA